MLSFERLVPCEIQPAHVATRGYIIQKLREQRNATMTIMALLVPLAGLIKVQFGGQKANIDSACFKLHYRTTTTLLFLACILVTATDFIGKTIDCISGNVPTGVLNTYCWIMSTFTVPGRNAAGQGIHYAHQGVAPLFNAQGPIRKHAYYQWVPFMLFLQGVMFYFPHYIWKTLENRKLDRLSKELREPSLNPEKMIGRCQFLVKFVRETWHHHNFYVFYYIMCNLLNFANVIGQMYFINRFLGGVFLAYGSEVLSWSESDAETRTDPLIDVFPRITKCTFPKYGPSGTIETHDAMCVLALNIVNEKVYIMFWFWLIFLAVVTSFYLLFFAICVSVPSVNKLVIAWRCRSQMEQQVELVARKAQIGDIFLMVLLSNNMSSVLFSEFIDQLATQFKSEV